MIPSQKAIDLIKQFEGCRLRAYQDSGGIWTIGWGTTGPGIQEGLGISQATADSMLMGHVREIGLALTDILGNFLLNQNQLDALTSFCYNVGLTAFRLSTMCKLIKAQDMTGASAEFTRWDHVDGVVSEGLLRRRMSEQALFLS